MPPNVQMVLRSGMYLKSMRRISVGWFSKDFSKGTGDPLCFSTAVDGPFLYLFERVVAAVFAIFWCLCFLAIIACFIGCNGEGYDVVSGGKFWDVGGKLKGV